MQDQLVEIMREQLALQIESFKNDPRGQPISDRIRYLTWNAFALCDEVHEAMQEVGWKPWATSEHVNTTAFRDELIDAMHFLLNLWMASFNEDDSPEYMASVFTGHYLAKRAINAQRQEDGYDGVSTKCVFCNRELKEGNIFKTTSGFGSFDVVDWFCQCGKAIDSSQLKAIGVEE